MDAFISGRPGRYLWLRLSLDGEGSATPSIERVRVYYPRQSSLRFMPAVFTEHPEGRDFLARYFSIADKTWDEMGSS